MQALVTGHGLPEAQIDDTLLRRGPDALLSRSALIDGLGSLVKTATVFPGNASYGRPTVNGSVSLFADDTGELDATLDFHILTKWKTAADSMLAASRLAPPKVGEILIVGSGNMVASMIEAYRSAGIKNWYEMPNLATSATRRGVLVSSLAQPYATRLIAAPTPNVFTFPNGANTETYRLWSTGGIWTPISAFHHVGVFDYSP